MARCCGSRILSPHVCGALRESFKWSRGVFFFSVIWREPFTWPRGVSLFFFSVIRREFSHDRVTFPFVFFLSFPARSRRCSWWGLRGKWGGSSSESFFSEVSRSPGLCTEKRDELCGIFPTFLCMRKQKIVSPPHDGSHPVCRFPFFVPALALQMVA